MYIYSNNYIIYLVYKILDDIVGHSKISKALKPLGIGVATGEVVSNRMQFKNYMQLNALQFVQVCWDIYCVI